MDKTILQYEISDWHQLKDCQSNSDRQRGLGAYAGKQCKLMPAAGGAGQIVLPFMWSFQ